MDPYYYICLTLNSPYKTTVPKRYKLEYKKKRWKYSDYVMIVWRSKIKWLSEKRPRFVAKLLTFFTVDSKNT